MNEGILFIGVKALGRRDMLLGLMEGIRIFECQGTVDSKSLSSNKLSESPSRICLVNAAVRTGLNHKGASRTPVLQTLAKQLPGRARHYQDAGISTQFLK